jgi:hypothetical protein
MINGQQLQGFDQYGQPMVDQVGQYDNNMPLNQIGMGTGNNQYAPPPLAVMRATTP